MTESPTTTARRRLASSVGTLLIGCVFAIASNSSRAADASPDFATEILPVLTRAGCNSGACHGAAAGRGGFRLSLLGGDPSADYDAIVHEFEGRRVNLARPADSLLIAKPTGQLDHGGGQPLEADSAGAARLADWIRAGVPRGSDRRLTTFAAEPVRLVVNQVPARVALRVEAGWDDRRPIDVTPWTVFTSTDPSAVTIDADGRNATILRRGQHVVIARFLDRVSALQWSVPLDDMPVDLSREPRANFIDDEILATLERLRIPVSPPADDATFLRRVTLDLTGRLPRPDDVDAFLADAAPEKRARRVDMLLASAAFADYWTLRLARLLRIHALPNETAGVRAYSTWLRQQIANDVSLDEVARELLTATGDAHEIGPANFGRMVADARGHAELVGQFFLGARLGCANCHNHPLDRWTQDDYHGLAAVFARLERGREVRLAPRGAVTNLRTGEPAVPRIPGERFLADATDPRVPFADWVTSPENRHFARATVNRLWRALFGRGLVEPPDDLRVTNPATHPELLERLADDFARHGFQLRHALRTIALSHAYARGDVVLAGNAADDRFYARAFFRPLPPEVLADAIADVTGVRETYAGHPAGTRAVRIVDPLSPAPPLDVLGRCQRAAGCDEAAELGGGLARQLHLWNGALVNDKLTASDGRLRRLVQVGRTNEQIVAECFRAAYGRPPSDAELAAWRERLGSEGRLVAPSEPPNESPDRPAERTDRLERLEDFLWSLLNSRAFLHNH